MIRKMKIRRKVVIESALEVDGSKVRWNKSSVWKSIWGQTRAPHNFTKNLKKSKQSPYTGVYL